MTRYILVLTCFIVGCNFSPNENKLPNSNKVAVQIKEEFLHEDMAYPYVNVDYIKPIDTSRYKINLSKNGNYNTIKSQVITKRNSFKETYISTQDSLERIQIIKNASDYFTNTLVNKIIPFWYGIEWDFEGHTNTPGQGYVACGYFVSTTLKHMGVNINRYRLAQQSGLSGAKTFHPKGDYKSITNYSERDIKDVITDQIDEGLYKVGLDCHVGYILYQQGELFFLHSSYLYPDCVVIEYANKSQAFLANSNYIISEVSTNEEFIKKWILNEEIIVVRDKDQ